jgi:glycosyltransferase involved in cell wall biosynthesis
VLPSLVIDATSFTTHQKTGIPNYAFRISERLLRIPELETRFFTFGEPGVSPFPPERLYSLGPLEKQVRWLIGQRLFRPGRTDWFWCPFYSWPLGLEKRARVILTVHDLLYRSSLGDRHVQRFTAHEKRFRTRFERAIRKADRIVAVSEATADQAAEAFGIDRELIPVAYPGVDTEFFRPVAPEPALKIAAQLGVRGRYILSLASVSPRRNLETVIRAFSAIAPAIPDVDLVIAGNRSYSPEYTEIIERFAAETAPGRIRFLDYIPEAALPAIYSGAELFVSASLFEGFDMPVVEAMACGTPVAVSDIPVHREVCGNAAETFEPLDDRTLAEILEARLARQKLGPTFNPGRFSWDESARFYAEIVSR